MHQGGGTGNREHGVSGRGESSPGFKQRLAHEQNQRLKERQEVRKRRRQLLDLSVGKWIREVPANRSQNDFL